jgi:hypothetical protein
VPHGTANSPAAWKSIRATQRKERARIRSENRGEEQHP